MDWTRIILAALAAGIASVLTDWFFMGWLFHDKMKTYPEVWRRPEGGAGETRAIVISSILGFFTCLVFVTLCARIGFVQWSKAWKLAAGIWLIVPVPLLASWSEWIKMHPLNLLSDALGWLAKLLLAAAAVAWLLP